MLLNRKHNSDKILNDKELEKYLSGYSMKLADSFCEMAKEKLKGIVKNFGVFNVNNDVNHAEFMVDFTAYDYFWVKLEYERGRFGCAIIFGDKPIPLNNSQTWWDEADFDIFFSELKEELELRIPDKYLKKYGWL